MFPSIIYILLKGHLLLSIAGISSNKSRTQEKRNRFSNENRPGACVHLLVGNDQAITYIQFQVSNSFHKKVVCAHIESPISNQTD